MPVSRLPAWVYSAIATIPVLILVSADFLFRLSFPLDSLSRAGLTLTALVWTAIFVAIGWKRLDESGREAHKFAWFFGGGLGLVAVLLGAMIAHFTPSGGDAIHGLIRAWASKWPEGQGGFMLGVLAAAIAQVIGYAVVWSGWWLSRRR
jgi:hypothetical protein